MHIVMIGIDKSLVGGPQLGDAVTRHIRYGTYVDSIDTIVYTHRREGRTEFHMSHNVTGHPSDSRSKALFMFDAIKLFKKINKIYKVDLVICQEPFIEALAGYYLKRHFGVKLLIHFHGDYWDNKHWLKERRLNYFFLFLSKILTPTADAIRVMSTTQKEKLLQNGIAAEKVRVIATPVNIARFIQSEKFAHYPWKKTVLMVGRKDPVKGYDVLFEAMQKVFEQNSDVGLVLIGSYTTREDVPLPKERVELLGTTISADLPQYYQGADVVVLPSYSESFGKVLVEAGASGKPVVATATSGAKDIVKDGVTGFLVPIGIAEKLAEKILYLLEHEDVSIKMGEKAQKEMVKRFSRNENKITEFWKEIVNKK